MRLNHRLIAAAALVVMAAPLAAQGTSGHSDFTGTWMMDPAKTKVDGSLPAPSAATYVITQGADTLTANRTVNTDGVEVKSVYVWGFNAKPWTNHLDYQGTDLVLSTTLSWSGAVLKFHTTTDFAGNPVEQDESWTMSSDGKTLTVRIDTSANGQAFGSVGMVFNKK